MASYKDILNRDFYYLDFESNKNGDLFLLGLEHNKSFTCYVINEDLSFLCDNQDYKENFNIQFENPKPLITNLLSKNTMISCLSFSLPTPYSKMKNPQQERMGNVLIGVGLCVLET